MNAADLVLGIDGGGTKTVAWLARPGERQPTEVVGRGRAGPGNLRAAGAAAALQALARAVDAAFADAGLTASRVRSACLGLAGADRAEEHALVQAWARQRDLAERVRIVHDALPVLYGGTPEGCGIALISGTGSFAFGRNAAGQTARCGGWGYLIGDEGSGYAIALAGLQAAARAIDGRGPRTLLLPDFLQSLGLQGPEELVPALYAGPIDRSRIAEQAHVVFTAAAQRDAVAMQIINRAAADLAELVTVLAERLQLSRGALRLALAGGVLLHQQSFRAGVLAAAGVEADRAAIVPEPVAGAVLLAALSDDASDVPE